MRHSCVPDSWSASPVLCMSVTRCTLCSALFFFRVWRAALESVAIKALHVMTVSMYSKAPLMAMSSVWREEAPLETLHL